LCNFLLFSEDSITAAGFCFTSVIISSIRTMDSGSEGFEDAHDWGEGSVDASTLNGSSDAMDETFDSSRPSKLRTSRRRVQKHSSVVLNAARVRRLTTNPSSDAHDHLVQISEEEETDHHDEDERNDELNGTSFYQEHHSPAKQPHHHHHAPKKHSPKHASPKHSSPHQAKKRTSITSTQAAFMILNWWTTKKKNRLMKFTQNGEWSFSLAYKVFSCFLGFRVRKFMKSSSEVTKLINSQRDIKRVIKELLEQYLTKDPRHSSPKASSSSSQLLIEEHLFYLNKFQNNLKLIDRLGPDQSLMRTLIKQLLNEREKLFKYLFGNENCQWHYFPKPGYWSFNMKKLMKFGVPKSISSKLTKSPGSVSSPIRPLRSLKSAQETPPHVKAAIDSEAQEAKASKKNAKLNLLKKNLRNVSLIQESAEDGGSSLLEESDESELLVVRSAANQNSFTDERPIKSAGGPSSSWFDDKEAFPVGNTSEKVVPSKSFPRTVSSRAASAPGHHQRPPTASAAAAAAAAAAKKPPAKQSKEPAVPVVNRKRNSESGHIQLEIVSGDKLIPAKKVSNSIFFPPSRLTTNFLLFVECS
jgi:hypothetical protein